MIIPPNRRTLCLVTQDRSLVQELWRGIPASSRQYEWAGEAVRFTNSEPDRTLLALGPDALRQFRCQPPPGTVLLHTDPQFLWHERIKQLGLSDAVLWLPYEMDWLIDRLDGKANLAA